MADCAHKEVAWGPVEMDYHCDGTAAIWQEGKCQDCNQMVQVDYTPGTPHTFSQAEQS